MNWKIELTACAKEDLNRFKGSNKKQIEKSILKVSSNPLPINEGGYGKPLGNHSSNNLSGFLKIKLRALGVRIIYKLVRVETKMQIVVISIRNDNRCYEEAEKRIKILFNRYK